MGAGGGLMQLVAYGAQDIYLTGEPQITFFKAVYRRSTNFAIESIQQTVSGLVEFDKKVSIPIGRNGDLLKKLWVEYSPRKLLEGATYVGANVGHSLFNKLEIEIGGQIIDTQYGTWLTIWNYLTEPNPTGQQGGISSTCMGPGEADTAVLPSSVRPTRYNRMAYTHRASYGPVVDSSGAPLVSYVPLQFWFCKNPGLAIPLIALQYHEVKLYITLNRFSGIAAGQKGINALSDFKVYADYIYIDTSERKQFAQNAHEYLIEQLQYQPSNDSNGVRLNFKHPVKELIWTIPSTLLVDNTNQSGISSPASGISTNNEESNTYKLIFNGKDRFTERDVTYFTRNQVWEHHTGFGSVLFPDSIAVYSFALRPEEHQPSGTCNFSRMDSAVLYRNNSEVIDIYAVNYNILRIMSGMGGLAYSN